MPLIYRLIICIAVATPLSAVYLGFHETGGLAYTFDPITAVFFVFSSIACVLLTGPATESTAARAKTAQTEGADKGRARKAKGAGEAKSSGKTGRGREKGTVKWFNGGKGFGFITRNNGEEIFVHFRSLQKGSRRLAPGLTVEFSVSQGEKGPEASDVVVL